MKRETVVWNVSVLAAIAVLHALAVRAGPGFDCNEYYLAADDWLRGLQPYRDFFFGKPPGIIWLTAGFFRVGSSAAGWLPWYTTAVNIAWAAAGAWALSPLLGRRARWIVPVALGFSAVCMANFWNTEQPMTVLICLALGCWLRREQSASAWATGLSGLWLGLATGFKPFAVLFLVPMAVVGGWRRLLALLAGYALPVTVWCGWAGGLELWGPFVAQAVVTPLRHYPAHIAYLQDFLTRAAWFVVPIAAGMTLSFRRAAPPGERMISWCGLPALVPLLKNQAAHYLIPWLPFAAGYVVLRGARWWDAAGDHHRRRGMILAFVLVLLAGAVAAGSKREAVMRLLQDDPLASYRMDCAELARWLGPDDRLIILNGTRYSPPSLYWGVGGRPYPWPFVSLTSFHRQAVAQLGFKRLYDVCRDTGTRIVIADVEAPMMEPALPWIYAPSDMDQLKALLSRDYDAQGAGTGLRYYLRKGSVPVSCAFRGGPYAGEAFDET